ncbi:hypothetical protein AX15_003311 [Amanita polypyramis BW_CC]|nr:hypothetical protein AX15_003311 [Amanita polypyramis BW_CC]
MIHPSVGIAHGHKPHPNFSRPSTGKLHISGSSIIMEPPFTKGRNSRTTGPLTALRDLPLPTLDRQNYDDLHPLGTRAIDLFKDRITHIDIPSHPKENLDDWKAMVSHILTPILNETTTGRPTQSVYPTPNLLKPP